MKSVDIPQPAVRVVISKAQLEAGRSCGVHLDNPFWDPAQEALVFSDWAAALEWYLSPQAPNGVQRLKWLAANKLIPMTKSEVRAILKARFLASKADDNV